MPKSLYIITLGVMLLSCRSQQTKTTPAAAYYWRTNFAFDESDRQLTAQAGIQKLYVRYFDVDWSPTQSEAVPLGTIHWDWDAKPFRIEELEIVPVVYLTQIVLEKESRLDSLAARIARKINKISEDLERQVYSNYEWIAPKELAGITDWAVRDSLIAAKQLAFRERMQEIQIDYDWTNSTREAYFTLLQKLKQQFAGKKLSCTVRLHQFRMGEKAGIPPVDQGMLMCYNVAQVDDPQTKDAILDMDLVKGYIGSHSYPLPLDAAIPMFSWGALFRENQFKGLARDIQAGQLEDNSLFETTGPDHFRFKTDTVFADVFVREGDELRLDGPNPEELKALMQELRQIKGIENLAVFDWQGLKSGQYSIH